MKIDLHTLTELFGNETVAQRFAEIFQQQAPIQLQTLQQAILQNDWDTVANTAHTLKSQCKYVGQLQAAEMLEILENNPSKDNGTELFALIMAELA